MRAEATQSSDVSRSPLQSFPEFSTMLRNSFPETVEERARCAITQTLQKIDKEETKHRTAKKRWDMYASNYVRFNLGVL